MVEAWCQFCGKVYRMGPEGVQKRRCYWLFTCLANGIVLLAAFPDFVATSPPLIVDTQPESLVVVYDVWTSAALLLNSFLLALLDDVVLDNLHALCRIC